MQIIPAIDVRGGACVQLMEGDPSQERLRTPDPVAKVEEFLDHGANRIHIVDLDGSLGEEGNNRSLIKSMLEKIGYASAQVGGGIREFGDIEDLLKAGAQKVVVGTRAIEDHDWLTWAAWHYRGKLAVALDARDDEVVINGWKTGTGIPVDEAALSIQGCGVTSLIYTDVGRDGHEEGPNLERCQELAELLDIELLASGGIATREHLAQLSDAGVDGAIIGTAVHTGSLALKDLF